MPPIVLLAYYCVAILVASVLGGMLPGWLRLTHRWMEVAVSLVAGVMLGVALLHLLPHALDTAAQTGSGPNRFLGPLQWALAGWLAMFFVERFFCFHHHDLPGEGHDCHSHDHDHGHSHDHSHTHESPHEHLGPLACDEHSHAHSDHAHDLSWGGAAFGLTLHSVLAGVALAASVFHEQSDRSWAGLGVFVAILLHKPFDSMTIAMLMARGNRSRGAQALANAAFALAVPAGALLFYLGAVDGHEAANAAAASALAFSAGMFLCISMSDLLPELQFHHHDRFKLSAALLLGLAVAWAACRFEQHTHAPPATPPLPAAQPEADS
ncbi:zinc transporter ZupT [Posidoniimonas polymericola]|uniref:Zinc transporter ZupT n=1 Tax=Posidoniimonas polymericola TaxID=2528002 RepID=A0A5C5YRB2_9BACT|nr:ZIP family metal transporter [Posidoniimonas polymericola]TWT77466.1 zinc transporter ZupT [Posidoniimonas polymericola]